jgi:hypothetical protein
MLNVLNRRLRHLCKLVNDNCTNNRKKTSISADKVVWEDTDCVSALEKPELELCRLKENSESSADNNTLVQVS